MKHLSAPATPSLMLLGWAAFHTAYTWPAWSWLLIIYLGCVMLLARAATARRAFYGGLVFGLGIVTPQLWFFTSIFGVAAVPLWMILALWVALFMLTANRALNRWPRAGMLMLPILWTAFEYTRCELYFLRFSWLTPGLGLPADSWLPIGLTGVYGYSFLVLLLWAGGALLWQRNRLAIGVTGMALAVGSGLMAPQPAYRDGPTVTGIQLEFPDEDTVMRALDQALSRHPDTDVFVLSEYAFQGPIPRGARSWCAAHDRYLIAGGKEPVTLGSEAFYNTAYVIDPHGRIVFQQAKSVPIQFFDDGEPATQQTIWLSPWGKIGLAICYDLSYTRVMDELVRQGAEAIVVPTMDVAEWGAYQHRLHAKVAPVRAREYGLPIVRVASSGISQIVTHNGTIVASAPYPAQNATISARVHLTPNASLPSDRYLAPLCVSLSCLIVIILSWPAAWKRP